jgi:uncharacterized phage protein (TIGR01671 family)
MILKFRAWHKKDKKMYDVAEIHFRNGKPNTLYLVGRRWIAIIEEAILLQSTGLKAKNCKELFSGDVVKRKIEVFNPAGCQPTGKDRWKYSIDKIDDILDLPDYELIPSWLIKLGNIYENPELMKKVEK